MDSLGERIDFVASKLGGKPVLAKAAGVVNSQVYRWIRGKNLPKEENLRAIAKAGNVSFEWLATGEDATMSESAKAEQREFYSVKQLRFEERAKAISGAAAKYSVGEPDPSKLAMTVMDSDAMEPTLHNSEIFVYDTTQTDLAKHGEGLYTFTLNDRTMTRRLQLLPDGQVNIICDNPIYQSATIHPEQVEFQIHGRARPTK